MSRTSSSVEWVDATTTYPKFKSREDIFKAVLIATANRKVFLGYYNKLSRKYYVGKKEIGKVAFFADTPMFPSKLFKETFGNKDYFYKEMEEEL